MNPPPYVVVVLFRVEDTAPPPSIGNNVTVPSTVMPQLLQERVLLSNKKAGGVIAKS